MKALVMLPTYNERENVKQMIEDILGKDERLDVLVVDDSSPDGTGELVDELVKENDRVNIIHRRLRGRGTAGLEGFRWAIDTGYDYLIEMDCDFSHDPDTISVFLDEIEGYDIVVGSRYVPKGDTVGWGIVRKLISSAANAYARAVLGLKIRDVTGGYKIFRVEKLKSLGLDDYVSDKSIYDGPETLLRASKAGLRIKEVPITFRQRKAGRSKITLAKIFRNIINYIRLRITIGGA